MGVNILCYNQGMVDKTEEKVNSKEENEEKGEEDE